MRHLVFYPASGRFDFLPGARAYLDAAHRDALRRITVGEKLGGPFSFADQSRLGQSLFRHFSALRQLRQIVETDDLMLYTTTVNGRTQLDALYRRGCFRSIEDEVLLPFRRQLARLAAELLGKEAAAPAPGEECFA